LEDEDMARIRIAAGDVSMEAELNDSASAQKLFEILPVEGQANRWGDEIYFGIPMRMQEDDAQAQVPSGTIAFWPPGNAFCIFFGQTPYSPVNVLGELDGDPQAWAAVDSGETVTIEKAD
jgi:hypothetical protein